MAKWKSTTAIRSSVQWTQIIDTIRSRGLPSKAISTEAQWAVFGRDQVSDNETKEYDSVLVAIGRSPLTENIGLDNVNIVTENGFIELVKSI